MQAFQLLTVFLLILVNGLFAAYEIALASVSTARLKVLCDRRRHGARAAMAMKTSIENSLAVVQLGITLVGLTAGATGGAGASEQIAPVLEQLGIGPVWSEIISISLVVLPLTAATIVIGELVPKIFALRNMEWVCLKLSPPMRLFAVSVWPVVWLLEGAATWLTAIGERLFHSTHQWGAGGGDATTLQELRSVASVARTSRLIGAREETIILGAARLASRTVAEIMLPAEHISMLAADGSLADGLLAAHMDMHTRFPVTETQGDPQAIVGYVNFKDIVAVMKTNPEEPSLRAVVRTIPSIRDSQAISSALEHLLRESTHIALVRDEHGRVLGMITLEDIVEELVGDIQDEFDLLPMHVVRAGRGWVVGGGASLRRLSDLTGLRLPDVEPAVDASGGAQNTLKPSAADTADSGDGSPSSTRQPAASLHRWIMQRIDRPPEGGDVIEERGLRITIRKVRRQRVMEAFLAEIPRALQAD